MFCVLDLLSLWALLEIHQEGVGKLTCCFTKLSKLIAGIASPVGKQVKRLLKFLGIKPIWLYTSVTPIPYDPSCYCCGRLRELTESNQESSLSAVRQLISDLYPRIFYYQVWNFQTGRSLLEDTFCQGGQLNLFSYVCHLAPYAFTKLNETMWHSGINKAVSIANFATVNAVYALECELLSKEVWLQQELMCKLGREMKLERERTRQEKWKWLLELELKLEWKPELKQELQLMGEQELKHQQELKWELELMRDLELKQELKRDQELKLMREGMLKQLEQKQRHKMRWELMREGMLEQELMREGMLEQELNLILTYRQELMREGMLGQKLERILKPRLQLRWEGMLKQELELNLKQRQELIQELMRQLEVKLELVWEQKQELMQEKKLELMGGPMQEQELKLEPMWQQEQELMHEQELRWKIMRELKQNLMQDLMRMFKREPKQELELELIRELKLKPKLKRELKQEQELMRQKELMGELGIMQELELMRELDLMQKLQLMRDQELTREQIQELKLGWTLELMREQTLEQLEQWWKGVQGGVQKALFFSSFPQGSSIVGKSIAAAFTSSDTVISVRSDSMVALWSQRMDKEKGLSFKFISEFSLPGSISQLSNIENWAFSPDGERAACRQGNKIQRYSTVHSIETLGTLLEGDFLDTDLVCLTFSADNIVLLICIQDGMNEPRVYEWDDEKKLMSPFKLPLLTVDCCCLSSDKTKFILCGECEIKIWEYNNGLIRLLVRGGIAQKSSIRFSYCAVSLDNELLVCCIANIIIVFRLCAPDILSSKQILRGHIGRIEFCKFLRVNRYLISYGVDGMVFLWDLLEAKAVGFTRIAQGQENIVSMAVSPEEERLVCFTSSGRVYVIRLWNLECAMPSKLLRESMKGKAGVTDTSLELAGEIASQCKPISYLDDYKSRDFNNSEEDERFLLTPDDLLSSGEESD